MSKHWNPAWQTGSAIYRTSPSLHDLEQNVVMAERMGFEAPEGVDLEPCESELGVTRMAVLGPDYTVLVRADQRERVGRLQEQIGRLVFYFICSRPRVVADPELCAIEGETLKLGFRVLLDDGSEEPLEHEEAVPDDVAEIRVDDAGRTIYVSDGNEEFESDPALLTQKLFAPSPFTASRFDLEVHYIGQAKGRLRDTCALDRLEAHSKYQRVLEHILATTPNRDIWLVMASGTTIHTMSGGDGDRARMQSEDEQAREALTEADRIDITEALLINYFKPAFNQQHKGALDLKTKVLRRCYQEAKLTGLLLAFSTEAVRAAIYTEEVSPRLYHAKKHCL